MGHFAMAISLAVFLEECFLVDFLGVIFTAFFVVVVFRGPGDGVVGQDGVDFFMEADSAYFWRGW